MHDESAKSICLPTRPLLKPNSAATSVNTNVLENHVSDAGVVRLENLLKLDGRGVRPQGDVAHARADARRWRLRQEWHAQLVGVAGAEHERVVSAVESRVLHHNVRGALKVHTVVVRPPAVAVHVEARQQHVSAPAEQHCPVWRIAQVQARAGGLLPEFDTTTMSSCWSSSIAIAIASTTNNNPISNIVLRGVFVVVDNIKLTLNPVSYTHLTLPTIYSV